MIDIQPTMNDSQVMDFISRGTVVVEGVVSDEFNRQCETLPGRSINEFACTPGFRNEVLLHPEIAGVARSLLGRNFLIPITAHHHLYEEAHPRPDMALRWALRIRLRRQSSAMLLLSTGRYARRWSHNGAARLASSIG